MEFVCQIISFLILFCKNKNKIKNIVWKQLRLIVFNELVCKSFTSNMVDITILKFGVTRKRQVALKWILSLKFVLIFLNHDLQSLSLFLSLTVSYSFRLFLFSLLSLSLLLVTHFLSLSQLSLSLSHSTRSS
jgi:hypothetical protein